MASGWFALKGKSWRSGGGVIERDAVAAHLSGNTRLGAHHKKAVLAH